MAGIGVTKEQVNAVAGQIALDIADTGQRVQAFKAWLDTKTVEDMERMGFTTEEATLIKSAYADAFQHIAIFTGQATLAQPKDFRVFLQQLWGFGRK